MNKKILVTGGLGFVGSHLVDSLVENNDVTVVDDLSTGQASNKNTDSTIYVESVQSYTNYDEESYDIIFHFANSARIARSFEYCEETLTNNYNSTVAICEYIKRTNPNTKLIFASSSTTEYADRYNNPYTFSKVVCDEVLELYKRHFGLNYDIVKFYNTYGSERESLLGEYTTIIRKYKDLFLNEKPMVVYGDGSQRRDFTHIEDTIAALHIIADLPSEGKIYHIGTENAVSILEIAEAFGTTYELHPPREYEVPFVVCKEMNVPGWQPKHNIINYIKEWVDGLS